MKNDSPKNLYSIKNIHYYTTLLYIGLYSLIGLQYVIIIINMAYSSIIICIYDKQLNLKMKQTNSVGPYFVSFIRFIIMSARDAYVIQMK